jgi:hypothetical protein
MCHTGRGLEMRHGHPRVTMLRIYVCICMFVNPDMFTMLAAFVFFIANTTRGVGLSRPSLFHMSFLASTNCVPAIYPILGAVDQWLKFWLMLLYFLGFFHGRSSTYGKTHKGLSGSSVVHSGPTKGKSMSRNILYPAPVRCKPSTKSFVRHLSGATSASIPSSEPPKDR